MRSRVMRRRMHRVLWKKLSRIYAVDMAEVLGWIEYISITGIFQCFCIVMACEQRGRVAFGGEYLILPAAILARLWIPEMIQSVSGVLEMPDEEEASFRTATISVMLTAIAWFLFLSLMLTIPVCKLALIPTSVTF